jgi:hypothetical protein
MNVRALHLLAVVLLASTVYADPGQPRLTSEKAIRLAVAAAKKDHVNLRSLMPPRATYDAKNHWWLISWDERPDKNGLVHVGGDFGAVVEDDTGKVTVIPGR